MEYTIRTVFGDSTYSYSSAEWTRAPIRNAQANGSGPDLWNIISSLLFEIVREQDHGMKIESAITKSTMHYMRFGYVDNTGLIQTICPRQTNQQFLDTAQKFLKLWEELLWYMSRALDVKDKSNWTFIDFV